MTNEIIEKKEFIGYSLDDKDYHFVSFQEFIKAKKLSVGSKYYVGVFENNFASNYMPEITNIDLLNNYQDDVEDFDDEENDNLIPPLTVNEEIGFKSELANLIDKYFKTNIKIFISKEKKKLTQADYDKVMNKEIEN